MAGRGRGSKNHMHMYNYVDLGYAKVWSCALPDCTHFIPLSYSRSRIEPRLIGKLVICFECRESFVVTEETLTEDRLRCLECKQGIKKEITDASAQMAERVLQREVSDAEGKAKFAYEFMYGTGSWERLSSDERRRKIEEKANEQKQM